MSKRRAVAWATVLLVTLGAYGVSQSWEDGGVYGPSYWVEARQGQPDGAFNGVYQPLRGQSVTEAYATLWPCYDMSSDAQPAAGDDLGTGLVRMTRPVPPGLENRLRRPLPLCPVEP